MFAFITFLSNLVKFHFYANLHKILFQLLIFFLSIQNESVLYAKNVSFTRQ